MVTHTLDIDVNAPPEIANAPEVSKSVTACASSPGWVRLGIVEPRSGAAATGLNRLSSEDSAKEMVSIAVKTIFFYFILQG